MNDKSRRTDFLTDRFCKREDSDGLAWRSTAYRSLIAVVATAACFFSVPVDAAEKPDAGPFAKAIRSAQSRTVKIFGSAVGRAAGYATGLVVSANGHVVTANSVILAGERIRIVTSDGKTHDARLVRRDEAIQTAMLKIDAATPDYFVLAEQPAAAKGDWVVSVSNAFKVADGDERLSVTLGIVSLVTHLDGKRGTQDIRYEGEAVLYDCITSNPGSPGGAVVSADGQLVGMIGRLLESNRTKTRLNYAVPAPLLAKFVAGKIAVVAKASVKSGSPVDLGIRLFRLGGKRGPAYVDRVRRGSPAANAGVKSDDLVLSIGGKRVRSVGDFQKLIGQFAFNQPIELLIKRKQKLMRLKLKPTIVKKP